MLSLILEVVLGIISVFCVFKVSVISIVMCELLLGVSVVSLVGTVCVEVLMLYQRLVKTGLVPGLSPVIYP